MSADNSSSRNTLPLYRFFRLHQSDSGLPAYIVESTSLINVDDQDQIFSPPKNTAEISNEDLFFRDIVTRLREMEDPTLLVAVHGYNSERSAILETFVNVFNSLNNDKWNNKPDAVCLGFRWPSEPIAKFSSLFGAVRNFFLSAPSMLGVLIALGLVMLIISAYLLFSVDQSVASHLGVLSFALIGAALIIGPISLWLLKATVYFRDNFRASTYGVHGLVELLAQIHLHYNRNPANILGKKPVKLIFVAHSMGAQVATGAVKILTDSLFRRREDMNSYVGASLANADKLTSVDPEIAFQLKRLVLISPDIPAEILLSGRNNFLTYSLQRFEEAILFSNEADVVLKQLSRAANYFSYPTKSSKFGHRLGNVAVISNYFGVIPAKGEFLEQLRLGSLSLNSLLSILSSPGCFAAQEELARKFSYFDCTSAVENGQGIISPIGSGEMYGAATIKDMQLLWCYLRTRNPDVHSGYFASPGLRTLIFRTALSGVSSADCSFNEEGGLDRVCQTLQVKAYLPLPSP